MPDAFPTRGGGEPIEGEREGTGRELDEANLAGDELAEAGFDPERESAGAGIPDVDADDSVSAGRSRPSAGREAPQGGLGV